MWKPSSVVPQHRNRAILVWVAILITALGYTVWQTTVVIRKRQNPSTKLLVSNQRYQFPLVSVCLENGFGCGYSDGSITGCVASAIGPSGAWYGDGWDPLYVDASQGQEANCVEFDLTQFEVPEGEMETAANSTASIAMDWISSDNASAEVEYSAGVYVYLRANSGDSQGAESTMVPYSRNLFASSDRIYESTALTIGKTKRKYLSGDSITNYPVLTISTTRFVRTSDFDIFSVTSSSLANAGKVTDNSAIATLFLELTQGSYSHTEVEDVEPLEIGALFGNVGGFWELLVLAWGVFFITKSRDTEPTLKARNFAKVLQRGATQKRKRRKTSSAAAKEEADHDDARPPDWDSSSDDDSHASGASDSGASQKGDEVSRRPRTLLSAGSRRPVAHPLPRRVSSRSVVSSLGASATTAKPLVVSRRSSESLADGPACAMPSTTAAVHWSGSNAAATNKFHSSGGEGMVCPPRKATFTVNGSRSGGSLSYNPDDGRDSGKARTSFFPSPQAPASRIHPDNDSEEDDSPRPSVRLAHETNNSVEDGEATDENDLELGYGVESEGRHWEA